MEVTRKTFPITVGQTKAGTPPLFGAQARSADIDKLSRAHGDNGVERLREG